MDIRSAVRMTKAGHVSFTDLKLPAHLPARTKEYVKPKAGIEWFCPWQAQLTSESQKFRIWKGGFKETFVLSRCQQNYIPSIPYHSLWRLFTVSTFCDNESIRTWKMGIIAHIHFLPSFNDIIYFQYTLF